MGATTFINVAGWIPGSKRQLDVAVNIGFKGDFRQLGTFGVGKLYAAFPFNGL